jgi:hypothetical protein
MTRIHIGITSLLILATLASTQAMAKPHDKHVKHHKSDVVIAIPASDRGIIFNYLEDHRYPHCPPGLAKKRNGCLPPGIAKKYALGQPLPPGIAGKHLPRDLLGQLHPMSGYQYVQVDQDVLLVSEATKKVVDAVTLLSAVQ